ncbi:hypothetical protein DFH06DRAFT_1474524 [Mycena polygramma]|nr:hypothetical protein DFH06DRAFT_1474524 [Mycena polygramma]
MRYTGKENIEFIFDYCPPKIYCTDDHATPIPPRNLTFYDRHIDESLSLRRVLSLASLLQTLAGAADEALQTVLDSRLPIPNNADQNGLVSFERARENAKDRGAEPIAGSYELYTHLRMQAFDFFLPTASLLLLRPLKFETVFQWGCREREEHWEPLAHGIPFVVNGNALTIKRRRSTLSISSTVVCDLDAETRDRLQGVVKHAPVLGTWQIYPPSLEGNKVLEDMGRIVSAGSFTPRICTTVGLRPSQSCCAPSHDAWTPPAQAKPSLLDVLRGASLAALRSQPLARRDPRITPAVPAHRDTNRSTEDFLQHGWNESVIEDSTFIVFTNGVFERIGIRHRETQTLFLSDLMSVSACKPAYGRVHIGLYVTAYHDAVDRYLHVRDKEAKPISHRVSRRSAAKRGRSEIDQTGGPSSRRKTGHTKTEDHQSTTERLFTETSSRNLLLVRLVYGIYNSVAPASFMRSGPTLFPKVFSQPPRTTKASYAPTEYATLTLGPERASGAIGAVHEAVFEVQTEDDQVLTGKVIVKLALYPDQQKRLRHEFSVYERLAAAKVTGIAAILGIYEDIESAAMLIVMSHCGCSLSQTRLMRDKTNVRVSKAEKAAFLAVIDTIHKAGVEHRDIRPTNLLLNDAGETVIIDFDQAELDPSGIALGRELGHFRKLLDGKLTSADAL